MANESGESNEMEARAQRIVATAVELAEQGGFEAVRLRDVASHAGVALGTLYRRFRSKEDLLVAVLERETSEVEKRYLQRPPKGGDELERVVSFFGMMTKGLLRRPNLARALIKSAAAGEPELARKVASFHERVETMIVAALRDTSPDAVDLASADPRERTVADTLEMIWFALLVGWSGGIHGQAAVLERLRQSAELVMRGARPHPG